MNNETKYLVLKSLIEKAMPFSGERFLSEVTSMFSTEFGAEFVFITRLSEKSPGTVDVLAATRNQQDVARWEFGLTGTPCALIYQSTLAEPWTSMRIGKSISITEGLSGLFESTKNTNYHSFIGVPLWDSQKKMIGHIALFFERNLVDREVISFIVDSVELFAPKVEAEINRMFMEEEKKRLLAELRAANKRLEHESTTDQLTHLYNRRYFSKRMQQSFAGMRRDGERYALILVDLDSLKKINDTYGHPIGDSAISRVAEILAKNTRHEVELVFRIGGDEFAILFLKRISEEMLINVEERVRNSVKNITLTSGDVKLPLTVSIGSAISTMEDSSWKDIYIRADEALYSNKKIGKAASRSLATSEQATP